MSALVQPSHLMQDIACMLPHRTISLSGVVRLSGNQEQRLGWDIDIDYTPNYSFVLHDDDATMAGLPIEVCRFRGYTYGFPAGASSNAEVSVESTKPKSEAITAKLRGGPVHEWGFLTGDREDVSAISPYSTTCIYHFGNPSIQGFWARY